MSHRAVLPALVSSALVLAASPAHAASYSPLDKYMLQTSIQGDRFEIAGGKLAQTNGSAPAVKALGARLEKDHTKSLREAIRLAKRLGVSIPKTPSPVQEWQLESVAATSGSAFDASYTKLEIQDHKQDIEEHKTEVSDGANANVRRLARKDLPTLRTHLKLSRETFAALKPR